MLGTDILDPTKPDMMFIADANSTSFSADANNDLGSVKIKHPKNQNAFDTCKGTNQDMFMIVTRKTKTAPPPQSLELAEQARLLQTQKEELKIVFSAWAGQDSAMRLITYTSAALVAAVFALF